MYDTILVPTDGSDHAHTAAAQASTLAAAFDAQVHVLGVVDVDAAAGPINAGGVDEAYVDRLREDARESIEGTADQIAGEWTTAIREGRPTDEIVEYVREQDVDLVCMGTHGRTGVRRFVAGSVTEDVLRRSPVPVLTARAVEGVTAGGYDDVLLPTDGSERAGAALAHCQAIASAFDATVHVLTVVDVGAINASTDYAVSGEVLERLRESGSETVESTARRLGDGGVDTVTAVREGYPASDILEYTEELGIDLVTMATAGQTGLSRFLLGSTTERVVRHAEVPVVAVNARDQDEG